MHERVCVCARVRAQWYSADSIAFQIIHKNHTAPEPTNNCQSVEEMHLLRANTRARSSMLNQCVSTAYLAHNCRCTCRCMHACAPRAPKTHTHTTLPKIECNLCIALGYMQSNRYEPTDNTNKSASQAYACMHARARTDTQTSNYGCKNYQPIS